MHTKEPWAVWNAFAEQGKDEYPTAQLGDLRLINPETQTCMGILFGGWTYRDEGLALDGNAARIVAAVNALSGIPTKVLEGLSSLGDRSRLEALAIIAADHAKECGE